MKINTDKKHSRFFDNKDCSCGSDFKYAQFV